MLNKTLFSLILLACIAPFAMAASSFQNSCSNIEFAYGNGSDATLKAVCLQSDGRAVPASLTLQGISNQNGKLTQGSGASSFQQSCGNIQILVGGGGDVTLSAVCRTSSGSPNETSLSLDGINNENGVLTQ